VTNPNPYGTPGRARATAVQIRGMRPVPHEVTEKVIRRRTMWGNEECWRYVSGRGDSAIFELEGEH